MIQPNRERARRLILKAGQPRIVTLCGSTRFKDQHITAQRELTLRGFIVIPCGLYGHHELMDMQGDVKRDLDSLHINKIIISDAIFVVNVGGYIGESTAREIAFARKARKFIDYLEPPTGEPFSVNR